MTTFETWVEKTGKAIEDGWKIDKARRLTIIIGLILYILAFLLIPVISSLALPNYYLWADFLLFIISVIVLIYGFYRGRKKKEVFLSDIFLYYPYFIIKKIDEYQKEPLKLKKPKLLIEIKKYLQDYEKYILSYEKYLQKVPQPEFDSKYVSSFKSFIYTLNFALSKNKELNNIMIDSVKKYCEQRILLLENYQSDIAKLIDENLCVIPKAIIEQNENLGGYLFHVFKYKSFIVQATILFIIVTSSVALFFGLFLPRIAQFSNDTLLYCACGVWLGIFLPLLGYIWSKK